MSQPMQETRQTILELLKKQGALSTSQLAEELQLHSMSIRQHLMALERDGYISYQRKRMPRGRPIHIYELTEEGLKLFPSNYEAFTLKLLDGIVKLEGEEKLVQIFQAQMESLLEEYQEKMSGREQHEQISILADLLNQAGYMVEWDATSEGFLLKEHHCAIRAIAEKYPQVCHQELKLMRKLFGTEVTRVCHKPGGDLHCSYHIAKREMN